MIKYYLYYHLQNQIAMREYAKKPESQSRTLDSNPKASKQSSWNTILQRYALAQRVKGNISLINTQLKSNTIQMGGCFSKAESAPQVQEHEISNWDINWRTAEGGDEAKLTAIAMSVCWALIIVKPNGDRLLAHLPSGDSSQLCEGGEDAIREYAGEAGRIVTIVHGYTVDPTSTTMDTCYDQLVNLGVSDARDRVVGQSMTASVDSSGNVTF